MGQAGYWNNTGCIVHIWKQKHRQCKMTKIICCKLPLKTILGFFPFGYIRNSRIEDQTVDFFTGFPPRITEAVYGCLAPGIKAHKADLSRRIFSSVIFPFASFLDARTTDASAFANASAVSYPIPLVAPVTIITFPACGGTALSVRRLSLMFVPFIFCPSASRSWQAGWAFPVHLFGYFSLQSSLQHESVSALLHQNTT